MDSKKQLVEDLVRAKSFEEFSPCMKTCMDVLSIITDNCPEEEFKRSYGRTIAKIGGNILSDPKKVRDEIVQLLKDEIESSKDIFLTYKLCVAVELLGETVTCISDSALCVTDLLSCVDEEKISSSALFLGFAFLKGVDLGK